MKYFYSATSNCFYPEELKSRYEDAGTWPSDVVEVSAAVYDKFIQQPPEGKVRGATKAGKPAWVQAPKPSEEEIARVARAWRNRELARGQLAEQRSIRVDRN